MRSPMRPSRASKRCSTGLRARTSRSPRSCSGAGRATTCSRSTASRGSSTRSATRSPATGCARSTASRPTSTASSRRMGGRSTRSCAASRPPCTSSICPRQPFQRLIEANRQDQRQAAYETFDELVGYCELSANPVGELVLHVFGAATPDLIVLSDRVCTALQLAEHWQDVAEDYRNGRIYLPGEDRRRFGVADAELAAPETGAALRAPARVRGGEGSRPARQRARASSGTCTAGRGSRWPATSAAGGRRSPRSPRPTTTCRRRPAGEQRPACPADPSHLDGAGR